MRVIWMLTWGVMMGLLLPCGQVSGQAADVSALDALTIYMDVSPAGTEAHMTLLGRVSARLATYDIVPVYRVAAHGVDDGSGGAGGHSPALHLAIRVGADRQHWAVSPDPAMRLALSPALVAAFGDAAVVVVSRQDPRTADDAADLVSAFALYAQARWEDAQPLFERLADERRVAVVPDTRAALRFYVAACALMRGEQDAARALYAALLPTDAPGWSRSGAVVQNLGWLYLQVGQADAAWVLYDSLFAALPSERGAERAAAWAGRAQLYALAFRYDDAVSDATQALDAAARDGLPDETLAMLYVLRGQFVLLLYEWDRALADFNAALAVDPAFADAYFFRGVLYYSVLDRERALADFERYQALAPEGAHTTEAAGYAASIQRELESLGP